jgi:serine phosphatase RsbU (regulator of sigma subunit)
VGRNIKPKITEIPLEMGLTVVIYTDGLVHDGTRRGEGMDVGLTLRGLLEEDDPSAQAVADALLAQAMRLDEGRPADDMSVVVMRVMPRGEENVRRMTVRLPLNV